MIYVRFTDRPGLSAGGADIRFGPFESVYFDPSFELPNGVAVAALFGRRADASQEVLGLPNGRLEWSVGVHDTYQGTRTGFVIETGR